MEDEQHVIWRKPGSGTGSGDGNRIEAATLRDGIAVRHSTDPAGPVLTVDQKGRKAFLGPSDRER